MSGVLTGLCLYIYKYQSINCQIFRKYCIHPNECIYFGLFRRILFFDKCQLELHFKSDLRQEEEEMLSLKYKQILQKVNFDEGTLRSENVFRIIFYYWRHSMSIDGHRETNTERALLIYLCYSIITCIITQRLGQGPRTLNTLSQDRDHPDYRVSIYLFIFSSIAENYYR